MVVVSGACGCKFGSGYAFAALDFDVDVDEADGCWRYACYAAGLAQGTGTDSGESLLHLGGEAADGGVVEPCRDGALLGFAHLFDGAALLVEVAGVFDFGFDCFHLVADPGREFFAWGGFDGFGPRLQNRARAGDAAVQDGCERFDGDFGALEQLDEGLAGEIGGFAVKLGEEFDGKFFGADSSGIEELLEGCGSGLLGFVG